jgi:hypothetical protein
VNHQLGFSFWGGNGRYLIERSFVRLSAAIISGALLLGGPFNAEELGDVDVLYVWRSAQEIDRLSS